MTEFVRFIIVFFCGACFVSAGNCIRYRTTKRMDWVRGRSVCEHCGKELRVYELVPVISCIVLKGTCKRCGHTFGYVHAITEAVGGALSMLLCLGAPDNRVCLARVLVFGFTYCFLSWYGGWKARKAA